MLGNFVSISPQNTTSGGGIKSPQKPPLEVIYTVLRESYIICRMNNKEKEKKARKAPLKPIQRHYGLEFALAHMGEDLSVVFRHLAKRGI